jgi:3-methyladenine DNA glycosylase AlkD
MVAQFERLSIKRLVNDEVAMAKRDAIVKTYLQYAHQANNWDLVDLSAPKILGSWLLLPTHLTQEEIDGKSCSSDKLTTLAGKQAIVDHLAYSDNLWRQRMSIVCSWKTSAKGDPSWCLRYAEIHLHHPHDLMHKAVGWMLREMGKRVSIDLLRSFLELHAHTMPRTTLRYAIEKMDESERQKWMKK